LTHQKKRNTITQLAIFYTALCNNLFYLKSNIPEEIKPALEEFKCETCDAIFFAKSHLMRHQIKVHQINHNYQCDLCHKVLGSKNDLKRHVESVHEKKKPYMCSKCLTTFSRKSYGKSHLKMVHKLDDLSLIIDTTIIEKEIDENQGTTVQKTNNQDVNVEEIETFQRALFKCLPCKVWQYRLWSFQGRDTELERFLAKSQL
jgi:hypothetical protein